MSRFLALTLAGAALALSAAVTAHSQRAADAPKVITYGDQIRLTGTVPADRRQTGMVRILSLTCGFTTYTKVAEFKVPANGAYTYRTGPAISTLYSIRASDIEISTLNVRVKPQVAVTKLGGGKYRADVTSAGGTTFGGKVIVFERAKSARGPWTKVSAPKLKHTSPATALNAVGSATISARLPTGSYLRARLAAASARPCYDGATSAAVGA